MSALIATSPRAPKPNSAYLLPVSISVLLHGLLILAVIWGWESSSVDSQKVTPRYVEAKLVTMKPKSSKPAAAKKKIKTIDLAAKKRQQQLEKKKKQALRRKNQLAKDKKDAALKAKKLADAKAEALATEQALEIERELRRAEELRAQEQLQFERQQEFADALAQEEGFLSAEQDEAMAQSYVALIAQAIERQWSRPPSARRGMKCELQLQLIPTGEVVSVNVSKSSGNRAFDRSAEQAVKKVGEFETLKDMPAPVFERYFRQFTLVFDPQDLRL